MSMSKRLEIIWTTEDGQRYLAFKDRDNEARAEPAPDADLEDLAELCDVDAEGANHHAFVGAHRELGILLRRWAGREVATSILREVAERGGLHGLRDFKEGGD